MTFNHILVALAVIAISWVLAITCSAIVERRHCRRAVFASLDSYWPRVISSTDANDVAITLRRYVLPSYAVDEMLPHVRAWLEKNT